VNIYRKEPAAAVLYTWSFTALLGTGETLSSVAGFTQTDCTTGDASTDLTVGTPALASPLVQALVSGGTAGGLYELRCRATTSAGQTLVVAGSVSVNR
jgi:hypothetical protein